MKVKILLILAIVAAFTVRFWRLPSLPFPPDGDEVAFGYYGWSLLHFGTDEYGKFLPISFPSIGDYKYPGLAYLNIIPAAVFGLSDITARFWNAFSGVALVPLAYLLSLWFFSSPLAAIAAAWLAALSPWSIIESRLGYENHISMVITAIAIVCLFLSFKSMASKSKRRFFTLASFSLFLFSSFTYGAQRIFIPLFLFSLFLISFLKGSDLREHRKKILTFFITLVLIIFASLIPSSNRGRATEDLWRLTPIDTDRLMQRYIQASISPVKIPPRLTWPFRNKYQVAVTSFSERYLDHFSPRFLFFFGEASAQKIPEMGLLLFAEILLLPLGFVVIFKKSSSRRPLIVLSWLLIAPIASALTSGGAHINRASLMVAPIVLISGYGFYYLSGIIGEKNRKKVIILASAGILLSSLFALNQIFVQKPVDRPWLKEQVNRDLTSEILKQKDRYEAVATGDDDYIFFLYYGKISPKEFLRRSEITPLTPSNKWNRVTRLDNIYFNMPFKCPKGGRLNVLYVCAGGEVPQNSKIIKTFYYLDGVPAYTLIEFYPVSKMPAPLPELPSGLHYMVEVETAVKDGIIPDSEDRLW